MPLNKSKSKKAFEENIKTEVKAGKPVKQAVAIAYATKGEKKTPMKKKMYWLQNLDYTQILTQKKNVSKQALASE